MKKILKIITFFYVLLLLSCSSTINSTNVIVKSNLSEKDYDINEFDENGINKITRKKYNLKGIDCRGFTKDGFNLITKTNYDKNGFSYKKIHKDTGKLFDEFGYDIDGFNELGWSKEGINGKTRTKYDKSGFDINGYDIDGFNKLGWNKEGISKDTGEIFNRNGWNKDKINKKTNSKYDENGYDFGGWDIKGINKDTNTIYNKDGFDSRGFNKDGKIQNSNETKQFYDSFTNPFYLYSSEFYSNNLFKIFINFVDTKEHNYFFIETQYKGKNWLFMDGRVLIKTDKEVILKKDENPSREVTKNGVEERLRVYLSDKEMDSIFESNILGIDFFAEPIYLTNSQIKMIKNFYKKYKP